MGGNELGTLRRGLHDLAEEVVPAAGYAERIRQRVTKHRRQRAAAYAAGCATAVVAVAVVAAGGFPMGSFRDGSTPAAVSDGPFLGWPATGNRVEDSGLLRQAVQAWDTQAGRGPDGGPHTDVRPLLVTQENALGSVVVVEGRDRSGQPRLAFMTASRSDHATLYLRSDRPAPDPGITRTVSLVSPWLQPGGRTPDSVCWTIALATPEATRVQTTSTAVDQELGGNDGGEGRRYQVALQPLSATALTTTVIAYRDGQVLAREPAQADTPQDVRPVAATVQAVTATSISATLNQPNPAIAAGQLVATPDGLVGTVRSVQAGTVDIQPLTSPSSTLPARTSISDYAGQLHGTGTGVVLTGVAPQDQSQVLPTNRVEVVDPAQTNPAIGAVTVGRVAAGTATDPSTFGIALSAHPKPSTTVFIITPPTAGRVIAKS